MRAALAEFLHDGLRIATEPDVYVPSENTFLLAEHAAVGPGRTVVEVGCGAGLASLVAARSGARAVAIDRNPRAVALTRRNARANGLAVHGAVADLLGPVRPERMDVLLANLGWVPSPREPDARDGFALATQGGPAGMALVARLAEALVAARPRLRGDFEAALVLGTLQDIAGLRARFEAAGFAVSADATRLHEGLVLLELRR